MTRVVVGIPGGCSLEELLAALKEYPEAIVRFHPGELSVLVAAVGERWPRTAALGVNTSEGFSAAVAAREIATLSFLAPFSEVVVFDERGFSRESREIIEALLAGGPVTMSNAAGSLTDAMNLPRPDRDISCGTLGASPEVVG